VKKSTLKWLYRVPGREKLYIAALIGVQALHGASGVLYALLLRAIVDGAAAGDAERFWRNISLIALLVAAQIALRAVIKWLTELAKSTLENRFKARLTDTLLHKDYLAISAVHSAEWLNRLTSDTKIVADHYVDILPGLSGVLVKLVSAMIMVIALEPRFAAILIPGGVALAAVTWLFRRILKRLHKSVQEADGRLRVHLQESIGNLLMIRSFAAERQTEERVEERMLGHKAARMRKNHISNLCNIGYSLAMNGIYLLGVGWCGYGILKGTISFGTLTAITQLISQIQSPFANITGYLPKYYAMLASAERLMEAEDYPDGDGAAPMPLAEIRRFYEDRLNAIGLKDVSFTYLPPTEMLGDLNKENMPVVLEHVTFTLRKGEYVAFTGQSGCGKSTILKLLMCVYRPDSGERYWRDGEGEEEPLTGAYRRLFAYVPQGNQLIRGTIREVVSFADPAAAQDESRLWNALTVACADGFVSELEAGPDTLLGERGTGLSEGQMQRLSIARAVFSGSPILLLDEATSALDEETESRLLRNLRSMTDRTVVIVTHRPGALSICDRQVRMTESGACRQIARSDAPELRPDVDPDAPVSGEE
jgi:ATP-binding cassette subfamily B protein